MRALVSHLQIVAAILIAMLAMGRGLPGIVSALRDAPSHVCTCASGGDHASCPVCNKTLEEHRASPCPEAKRVPCGNGHVADAASGEVVTLPAPVALVARSLEKLDAPSARYVVIRQFLLEPATPPPRSAST
jgi:hypothetical protein